MPVQGPVIDGMRCPFGVALGCSVGVRLSEISGVITGSARITRSSDVTRSGGSRYFDSDAWPGLSPVWMARVRAIAASMSGSAATIEAPIGTWQ